MCIGYQLFTRLEISLRHFDKNPVPRFRIVSSTQPLTDDLTKQFHFIDTSSFYSTGGRGLPGHLCIFKKKNPLLTPPRISRSWTLFLLFFWEGESVGAFHVQPRFPNHFGGANLRVKSLPVMTDNVIIAIFDYYPLYSPGNVPLNNY